MNSKISNHFQELIQANLKYLENTTIKSSLDKYKENVLRDNTHLDSEIDRSHNLYVMNSFYNESMDALKEDGEKMNGVLKSVVQNLKNIDKGLITESIKAQIMSSIEDFELKEEYSSFNWLLFGYDGIPRFSGMAFKEPQSEIILDDSNYQEFENGDYACDRTIDIELEELLEPVLGEDFEETAWAFEFELKIFLKVKETAYSIVALCLHDALKSADILNKLKDRGFEKNGVVYFGEHDMPVKTVFVNE